MKLSLEMPNRGFTKAKTNPKRKFAKKIATTTRHCHAHQSGKILANLFP